MDSINYRVLLDANMAEDQIHATFNNNEAVNLNSPKYKKLPNASYNTSLKLQKQLCYKCVTRVVGCVIIVYV